MLSHNTHHISHTVDGKGTHRTAGSHGFPGFGVGIVGIDYRHTISRQTVEDGTLFTRHLIEIAHAFEVRTLGVGDQRHGRRANRCQIGDFARMVHTHLDHGGAMRGTQAKQSQRQADIVIQVAAGGQHRSAIDRLQDGRDHFFGGRLSVRAGHRDHRQRELRPPGCGQAAKRQACVVDHDGRSPRWQLAFVRHQHGGSPRLQRLSQKIVGIETLANQSNEQTSLGDASRIGGHAFERHIGPNQTALHGLGNLRQQPIHADFSCLLRRCAKARPACSTSEKGRRTLPIS